MIAFTEEDFERMEHSPERRRGYCWRVAMNARLLAARHELAGREKERMIMDSFSKAILDNIDLLVEVT